MKTKVEKTNGVGKIEVPKVNWGEACKKGKKQLESFAGYCPKCHLLKSFCICIDDGGKLGLSPIKKIFSRMIIRKVNYLNEFNISNFLKDLQMFYNVIGIILDHAVDTKGTLKLKKLRKVIHEILDQNYEVQKMFERNKEIRNLLCNDEENKMPLQMLIKPLTPEKCIKK
jgi:hypothetical protein